MKRLSVPEVQNIVQRERLYQDRKWPQAPALPPSDELRLIRVIANQADANWYTTQDVIVEGAKVNPADLQAIRKIAAVCQRCLETWAGEVSAERKDTPAQTPELYSLSACASAIRVLADNWNEVTAFLNDTAGNVMRYAMTPEGCLHFVTRSGTMSANRGDWLVRTKGRVIACKENDFRHLFEPLAIASQGD